MAKKIVVLLLVILIVLLGIGLFNNIVGGLNKKEEPVPTEEITPTPLVEATPEPTEEVVATPEPTPITYSSYCSSEPSMPEGTCTFAMWTSGVDGGGPGYMGGTETNVLNSDGVVQQFVILNKKLYTSQDISSVLSGISVGGNTIYIATNTDQGENPYQALSDAVAEYGGTLTTGGHSGYRNPLSPYGSNNGTSFCNATGTWAADGYSDHSTGLVIDLRPDGL